MRRHLPFRPLLLAFACMVLGSSAIRAQESEPATPAFTLATSHVFNTKEHPSITITYRQVDHLDFRVYRVNDPFAFFAKLRDPHELGSEEPIVPQERTWLERIADWKAERRAEVRWFARQQLSQPYRTARSAQKDKEQVVLRQTLNVNSFAQVPLLNASQLVTSWREILPPVRESEFRRIPLDLTATGIFVVEAVNPPLKAYTVVMVSDVGLVTKTAPGEMLVFAADRFSGAPMPNCRVQVMVDQKIVAAGTTDADGTLQTAVTADKPDSLVTLADCGGQAAATDPGAYTIREPTKELVGYTYTDRPVYRPGHVVRFKSVLRWREKDALTPFGKDPVELSIVDGNDKVLLRQKQTVDAFGSVTGSFTIPTTASLGYYVIRVVSGEATASGSFEVQEYRKPEFDVAVRAAQQFQIQGKSISATITARDYFGQPVAGASVKYVVQRQGYYSPLRYDGPGDEDAEDGGGYAGGDQVFEGTARLNDAGTADITIPLEIDDHSEDYTARIEARVIDSSGREVSGATSVVATYGRYLLIARPERYVYSAGDTANINIRALDYAGAPQGQAAIHVVLERVDYGTNGGEPIVTAIQQGDVTSDADGRAQWSVAVPQQPGSYRVRTTAPSEDRQVTDTTSLWVPGRTDVNVNDFDQFLELIADRRTYQPGDTAQVIVRGADFDTSVLVTKESQHVSFHQVVKAHANQAIAVPISEEDIGDTYVSIAFLKDDRLFRAERRLSVPAVRRELAITAEADRPIVRPGEPGLFTLHVADANGKPVKAQLSVGLVDEALYGVRPDTTPNPLRFFYRREYNMVGTGFSRDFPFVGYSGTQQLLLAKRRRGPLTLADFKADRPDRPRVRKDFPDTVFWVGDITTNADGAAQVKVDYPDSLTTWRLTVRGITVATEVGSTTTHTLTTKDLILRVITPRFLTEGDQVGLPTIVHNYLPAAKTVSVSLSADGLTASDAATSAGTPRPLQVAQNGQQRVDWTFKAEQVRQVTVTSKATSDVAGDAVQVSLPVLPAGLQRNMSSAGSIVQAGERSLDLMVPPTANASGRSIRVALAPSLAGTMLGALDYLTSFPWGCTEQTLSSFVPDLVVLRAMSDMQIAPTERLRSLDRQVSDGLQRLYDYQHEDGGWGWWKTDQNHPFMTAYAIDGLLQARDNGVKVDAWRIANAANVLRQLYTTYPRAIPDLRAYIIYVLTRVGGDTGDAFNLTVALNDLWEAHSRMTASGKAFLLMTFDPKDARAQDLAKELVDSAETRGDVSWWPVTSDPLLEDLGDTSVEGTALVLKALASRDVANPLLERAARWLVLNRTSGYWFNTKQTALALEGLLTYMRARGETPAPVTAEIFVNNASIGKQVFDAKALTAPNPVLIESPASSGLNTVRIISQGPGALYYDASVRYYDKPAAENRTGSRQLALVRKYSTLSPVQVRGRTVYREGAFKGTAKAGDLLLVRLTVAGAPDWRYLMVEDPIPAGAEQIENEEGYDLEKRGSWFYGSQREFRDDRTTFFLDTFTRGRYEFTYLLRVTQPGSFSAMPARIAPMYVPDISASSDVVTLTVSPESVK